MYLVRKITTLLIASITTSLLISGMGISVIVFAESSVSITNLTDADKINIDEIDGIEVEASDDIEKLELYINGDLVADDIGHNSYMFSKDVLTLGKLELMAKAYKGDDVFESKKVSVSIYRSFAENAANYEFEDYMSGLPTGFLGSGDFLKAVTVDDEHGTSLALNMREGSTTPWLEVKIPDYTGNLHFETEVFLTEHIKDCTIRFQTLQNGTASLVNLVTFTSAGKVNLYSNGKVAFTCDEKLNNWYKFVLDIRMGESAFDIYMYDSGDSGTATVLKDCVMQNEVHILKGMRYNGPYVSGVGNYMAVDNIKYDYLYETPIIDKIFSKGREDQNTIDFETDTINLSLSNSLYAPSITNKKVTVQNFLGEVEIDNVAVQDNIVIIKLAQPLESNIVYSVTFSEDVEVKSGLAFGTPLNAKFLTSMDDIEVLGGEFTQSGDGMLFNAEILNSSESDKTIHIISEIWTGRKFISATAFDTVIKSGTSDSYNYSIGDIESGSSIKIFIIDNYSTFHILTKKVLTWNGIH